MEIKIDDCHGTSLVDETVLNFDCGDGYVGGSISQNSLNHVFKMVRFTVRKLYFSKDDFKK